MANFMVAHVQKFKKDDVRGLEIHFERSSENLSNKDIDHERSRENYDLLANGTPIRSRVKELVESRDNPTQTALRKDAVVMCSVLVSASPDVFKGRSDDYVRRYFETATEWLCNEFGRENAVSAYVHMDEETPHMHFAFVPLTPENKLSCKNIVNRKALQRLQSDLPKYLQSQGFSVQRGLENSPRKHVDTTEWKREERFREMVRDEIKRELQVKQTPEKDWIRRPTGMVIVDPNELEKVVDIALSMVENRLAKRQQLVDELKENRKLKAENEKQMKIIKERQKKQAAEADRLTKKASELTAKEEQLRMYKRSLEAQDNDLALQRLARDLQAEREALDRREQSIIEEGKRQTENIKKGVQIAVHNALKNVPLRKFEGNYMEEWKKKDPNGYKKAMEEQRSKAFARANEEANREVKKDTDLKRK